MRRRAMLSIVGLCCARCGVVRRAPLRPRSDVRHPRRRNAGRLPARWRTWTRGRSWSATSRFLLRAARCAPASTSLPRRIAERHSSSRVCIRRASPNRALCAWRGNCPRAGLRSSPRIFQSSLSSKYPRPHRYHRAKRCVVCYRLRPGADHHVGMMGIAPAAGSRSSPRADCR